MLTNIKPVKVTPASGFGFRSGLLDSARFTADLDGVPIIFESEGDELLWFEPVVGKFEHVADDDREGYLVGEVFIDVDIYQAAYRRAEFIVLELAIAANEALTAWAATVVEDQVLI